MNQFNQFIKSNWISLLTIFITSTIIQSLSQIWLEKKLKKRYSKLIDEYEQKLKEKDTLIKSLSDSLEKRYQFINEINAMLDKSTSELKEMNENFADKLLKLKEKVFEKDKDISQLRNELLQRENWYQVPKKEKPDYVEVLLNI
ncbi:MAG: hypothetical protein LBR43_03495 [Spiroplasmataceae bacterium]|nr:hypothetical protein [Spiroplasmataceae bacterium]